MIIKEKTCGDCICLNSNESNPGDACPLFTIRGSSYKMYPYRLACSYFIEEEDTFKRFKNYPETI